MANLRLITTNYGMPVDAAPPSKLVMLSKPRVVETPAPIAEIQKTVKELRASVMGAAVALEVLAAHGIVQSRTFETLVDNVERTLEKLDELDEIMSRTKGNF